MNIKHEILKIIRINNDLSEDLDKISGEISIDDYLESLFKFIEKYGNHPKLIIKLLIALQLNDEESLNKYSDIDIEEVFKSTLEISDDSELLFEFFKFSNISSSRITAKISNKYILEKIEAINNDLDLIKNDEDFNIEETKL